MKIQVRPWGQRRAIILDDAILDQLGIKEDSLLELTYTEDNEGLILRPAEREPDEVALLETNFIQRKSSPRSERVLRFLRSTRGQFHEPDSVPLGKRFSAQSGGDLFAYCGRAAFEDEFVTILRGRIGYRFEKVTMETLRPEWEFRQKAYSISSTARRKDQIVLALLASQKGRFFTRQEIFQQLHRRWRGPGGIMLRDVDICGARLAFTRPDALVFASSLAIISPAG